MSLMNNIKNFISHFRGGRAEKHIFIDKIKYKYLQIYAFFYIFYSLFIIIIIFCIFLKLNYLIGI